MAAFVVDPALDLRILGVLVGHSIALDLQSCTFRKPNADEGKILVFRQPRRQRWHGSLDDHRRVTAGELESQVVPLRLDDL
jgi:hypothetical protein